MDASYRSRGQLHAGPVTERAGVAVLLPQVDFLAEYSPHREHPSSAGQPPSVNPSAGDDAAWPPAPPSAACPVRRPPPHAACCQGWDSVGCSKSTSAMEQRWIPHFPNLRREERNGGCSCRCPPHAARPRRLL